MKETSSTYLSESDLICLMFITSCMKFPENGVASFFFIVENNSTV